MFEVKFPTAKGSKLEVRVSVREWENERERGDWEWVSETDIPLLYHDTEN